MNQGKIRLLVIVFALLFSTPFLTAENEKGTAGRVDLMSALNTLRISSVSGPALSPDGQWVVYTKRERDVDSDDLKAVTHIWRVHVDGTQRRQMTRGANSCSSPSWFPDGNKLAFLSSSKKAGDAGGESNTQIFFMHMDGGEAWQVTKHEEGISSFSLSPDGKKILFTARDPLSKEEKERQKNKDDEEVVDQNFRMSHLWIYDIEKEKESRLTEGKFTVSGPEWSPDSRRIAYEARPNTKIDEIWNSDIWVIETDSKESRNLYDNPGSDSGPRWSPDGKAIAFASDPHTGTNTWYKKLLIIPYEGGQPGLNPIRNERRQKDNVKPTDVPIV